MKTGVQLLLEPGTRIPRWISNQTMNVKVGHGRLKGRMVRSLVIHGGKARFSPGGQAAVKMPGSDQFWMAFQPLRVIEIRDFQGLLIAQNHYLCPQCATLTDTHKREELSRSDGSLVAFECTRCGNRWELRGI